eukprot:9250273-Alexandrium_andersonii.AAC.1
MSASLVGSEMCIRDSLFRALINLSMPAGAASGLPRVPWPAWVQHDEPKPVSYTHLTLPTICSV